MKILMINKFFYINGGSETYFFTIAETLIAMGHQVIYFSMQDKKNYHCNQEKYFVSNVGIHGGIISKIKMVKNIVYSKEAYNKMNKLLDAEKPDIAILNLIHKQITCSIIDALKEHNVKIVWTMHDLITVCPSYTMLDGKHNICEKCLNGDFDNCKKNKCIHNSILMSYLSTYEAKQIRKRGWYNDVDLYICPSNFYKNKLEQGKFTLSKIVYMKNPLPLDTHYAISNEVGNYVLYFGRLSSEKGLFTLVQAMENVDYKLFIMGTGPEEGKLKLEVSNNKKIKNKIEFLGFKTGVELNNYIKKAKAVIIPSEWYENGPYSAMEAMGYGRPLIVSNIGGLPELVQDGVNGFIFNLGDKKDLSLKINELLTMSKSNYNKMCENALEYAKNNFNSIRYCDNLLNMINGNYCEVDKK